MDRHVRIRLLLPIHTRFTASWGALQQVGCKGRQWVHPSTASESSSTSRASFAFRRTGGHHRGGAVLYARNVFGQECIFTGSDAEAPLPIRP